MIAVFLDTKSLDDKIPNIYLKHSQSIEAAIQNMLLAAHELGLGTCWIGEILKNEDKVRELLRVSDDLQLMAVISVGYSSRKDLKSKRNDISENNYSCIRLDAYSGNETALKLYENFGYKKVGQVYFSWRDIPFYCYEKNINSTLLCY
ncbi:nitroreductase family protein [Clostridium estertheticum]|uniref:nitroreductase family protein n=1 Tax=Clostridium estertheticum TaxID=238834 RepID=UPI001CF49B90|nr:nitroreductase family protein [Clostridium estertheticum]MCB2361714.1 nitroreductase family protein [Clostridium estertheticum]